MAAIVVIVTCVFLPILSRIEASADKIMMQFVLLDRPVRELMWQQAQARLRTLRRDHGNEDDDDADSASDSEEEDELGVGGGGGGGSMPALHEEAAHAAKPRAAHRSDVRDQGSGRLSPLVASPAAGDGSQLMAVRVTSAANAGGALMDAKLSPRGATAAWPKPKLAPARGRQLKQAYRKSGRSFCLLAARFAGPLVMLSLLFVTVFAVFSDSLNKSATLSAIAAAAAARASCSKQSMVDLRKLEYMRRKAGR